MIKIQQAVIVEGRYDKIKLTNILDALIIETNGFQIFRDKEKKNFIKRLADERGIIVITDSDHSGFQIRNFVSMGIDKSKVHHIYIPDVFGKERRKAEPSKEGKLGVEGIDDTILINLFNSLDIAYSFEENRESVTNYDLFEAGLSGTPDAKKNKKAFLKKLNLPEFLSTNSLLSYINTSMTKEEFISIIKSLQNGTDCR